MQHAWKTSKRRCPQSNQIKCLNHLNKLISMQRSSSSALSSLRMMECLTLSLRLSPGTLQRKLNLVTFIVILFFGYNRNRREFWNVNRPVNWAFDSTLASPCLIEAMPSLPRAKPQSNNPFPAPSYCHSWTRHSDTETLRQRLSTTELTNCLLSHLFHTRLQTAPMHAGGLGMKTPIKSHHKAEIRPWVSQTIPTLLQDHN